MKRSLVQPVNNARGNLAYVSMIIVVLAILMPTLMLAVSTAQLGLVRGEHEKKATSLAVNGLQSIVAYPGDFDAKLNNLLAHYYAASPMNIVLPEGTTMKYYQYLVPPNITDPESARNPANIVPKESVQRLKYNIVVSVTAGNEKFTKTIIYRDFDLRLRTNTPLISTTYHGATNVSGTAEPGSEIKLTVSGSVSGSFTRTALANGSYTIPLGTLTLSTGDRVTVTATNHALNKTESQSVMAIVVGLPVQTAIPTIEPLLKDGATVVAGKAEPNSQITVTITGSYSGTYTGTASATGAYSITVPRLRTGDVVKATAQAPGKTRSLPASTTVLAASAPGGDGIVIIIGEDGQTYTGFQDVIATPDQVVITTGVGNYTTGSNIDLTAGNGITVQPGVSLTTTETGSSAGLKMTTTGGDITMNGARLANTGSSVFSTIELTSANHIYLEDAVLAAERDITLRAGGNIYATNASLQSFKNNADITLIAQGTIYLNGMQLNKNAAGMAAKICGKLRSGSLVNGQNDFLCAP